MPSQRRLLFARVQRSSMQSNKGDRDWQGLHWPEDQPHPVQINLPRWTSSTDWWMNYELIPRFCEWHWMLTLWLKSQNSCDVVVKWESSRGFCDGLLRCRIIFILMVFDKFLYLYCYRLENDGTFHEFFSVNICHNGLYYWYVLIFIECKVWNWKWMFCTIVWSAFRYCMRNNKNIKKTFALVIKLYVM